MSETIQETTEKKKNFLQMSLDFIAGNLSIPLVLLLLNSLAQGSRQGIFILLSRDAISKSGNDSCGDTIWEAFKRVDESTYYVGLTAIVLVMILNWRSWFFGRQPSADTDVLAARKTYGQVLLMTISYFALLDLIHVFKAQSFLESALLKCSLPPPIAPYKLEDAMLTGFNYYQWPIYTVSVAFVIIANLFMRRRFPRPNPWKNDDKIQA